MKEETNIHNLKGQYADKVMVASQNKSPISPYKFPLPFLQYQALIYIDLENTAQAAAEITLNARWNAASPAIL